MQVASGVRYCQYPYKGNSTSYAARLAACLLAAVFLPANKLLVGERDYHVVWVKKSHGHLPRLYGRTSGLMRKGPKGDDGWSPYFVGTTTRICVHEVVFRRPVY